MLVYNNINALQLNPATTAGTADTDIILAPQAIAY